eukprot:4087201-Amphidinium_carterae.1
MSPVTTSYLPPGIVHMHSTSLGKEYCSWKPSMPPIIPPREKTRMSSAPQEGITTSTQDQSCQPKACS